jgi:hypothetical protein
MCRYGARMGTQQSLPSSSSMAGLHSTLWPSRSEIAPVGMFVLSLFPFLFLTGVFRRRRLRSVRQETTPATDATELYRVK